MRKTILASLLIVIMTLSFCALSWARGTRYVIQWPKPYIGPVYVQIYDLRFNPPITNRDEFKVWVTWGKKTKAYYFGNRGSYLIKMYKYEYYDEPMIISGNAASFKIRYSMTPPWI